MLILFWLSYGENENNEILNILNIYNYKKILTLRQDDI